MSSSSGATETVVVVGAEASVPVKRIESATSLEEVPHLDWAKTVEEADDGTRRTVVRASHSSSTHSSSTSVHPVPYYTHPHPINIQMPPHSPPRRTLISKYPARGRGGFRPPLQPYAHPQPLPHPHYQPQPHYPSSAAVVPVHYRFEHPSSYYVQHKPQPYSKPTIFVRPETLQNGFGGNNNQPLRATRPLVYSQQRAEVSERRGQNSAPSSDGYENQQQQHILQRYSPINPSPPHLRLPIPNPSRPPTPYQRRAPIFPDPPQLSPPPPYDSRGVFDLAGGKGDRRDEEQEVRERQRHESEGGSSSGSGRWCQPLQRPHSQQLYHVTSNSLPRGFNNASFGFNPPPFPHPPLKTAQQRAGYVVNAYANAGAGTGVGGFHNRTSSHEIPPRFRQQMIQQRHSVNNNNNSTGSRNSLSDNVSPVPGDRGESMSAFNYCPTILSRPRTAPCPMVSSDLDRNTHEMQKERGEYEQEPKNQHLQLHDQPLKLTPDHLYDSSAKQYNKITESDAKSWRQKEIERAEIREKQRKSIFGGAKPVDTATRDKEIEERLQRERQTLNQNLRKESEEKQDNSSVSPSPPVPVPPSETSRRYPVAAPYLSVPLLNQTPQFPFRGQNKASGKNHDLKVKQGRIGRRRGGLGCEMQGDAYSPQRPAVSGFHNVNDIRRSGTGRVGGGGRGGGRGRGKGRKERRPLATSPRQLRHPQQNFATYNRSNVRPEFSTAKENEQAEEYKNQEDTGSYAEGDNDVQDSPISDTEGTVEDEIERVAEELQEKREMRIRERVEAPSRRPSSSLSQQSSYRAEEEPVVGDVDGVEVKQNRRLIQEEISDTADQTEASWAESSHLTVDNVTSQMKGLRITDRHRDGRGQDRTRRFQDRRAPRPQGRTFTTNKTQQTQRQHQPLRTGRVETFKPNYNYSRSRARGGAGLGAGSSRGRGRGSSFGNGWPLSARGFQTGGPVFRVTTCQQETRSTTGPPISQQGNDSHQASQNSRIFYSNTRKTTTSRGESSAVRSPPSRNQPYAASPKPRFQFQAFNPDNRSNKSDAKPGGAGDTCGHS